MLRRISKFRWSSIRRAPLPVLLLILVALIVLIGTFLLWLPVSSSDSELTEWSTALFTAISAVTVTGLVVVDSGVYWSLFGQIVLLVLIFFGGLGFITGVAFLLIAFGQYIRLQDRVVIREDIGGSLSHVLPTVRNIVIMAVTIQVIGTALLFVDFFVTRPLWQGITWYQALWQALFHSVSGFNNAGFEVISGTVVGGSSLSGINDHIIAILVLTVLVLFGSLSYPFLRDIWVNRGRFNKFGLNTKLVITGLIGIFVIGGAILFITESSASALGDRPIGVRVLNVVFEVVGARTSGLTTVEQSSLSPAAGVSNLVLSFIGGVATSTAGGIKITTFVVVLLALFVALTGRERIRIFRRSISPASVRGALVLSAFAVTTFVLAQFAVVLFQPSLNFFDAATEVMAALSTNGLSRGITSELNLPNRILIMVVMLIGRYGPLMLALNFLSHSDDEDTYQLPVETVRIG